MSWDRLHVPVASSDGETLQPLNRAAVRLLGDGERACADTFSTSLATWDRLVRRCRRAGALVRMDLQATAPDGSARTLRVGLSPDEDGQLLLTLEDRTPQRAALADEQRSRRFLKDLLDQTPTMFFVVDRDGQIVFRNAAFDRIAGEATRTLSPASLPQLAAEFHDALACAFGEGEKQRLSVSITGPQGSTRRLQLNLEPLRDPAGRVHQALVVGFDLTDVLEAHAEQRRLQGQLAEARRLEALGQMAGTIAHDFNNLLTVMLTSAMLLREFLPEADDTVIDTLDALEQVTEQAQDLTQDLVAFSRSQVHSVRSSPLGSVLAAIDAALPRLVPPSVTFAFELPSTVPKGAPMVPLSEAQCLQITVNIVKNAIDATGGSGRIEVALTLDDDALVVVVDDDGPGIPPAVTEKIFEPFYTTRGDDGGTGLGLSSVRSLVERVGGSVAIGQAALGGASFRVVLPLRPS